LIAGKYVCPLPPICFGHTFQEAQAAEKSETSLQDHSGRLFWRWCRSRYLSIYRSVKPRSSLKKRTGFCCKIWGLHRLSMSHRKVKQFMRSSAWNAHDVDRIDICSIFLDTLKGSMNCDSMLLESCMAAASLPGIRNAWCASWGLLGSSQFYRFIFFIRYGEHHEVPLVWCQFKENHKRSLHFDGPNPSKWGMVDFFPSWVFLVVQSFSAKCANSPHLEYSWRQTFKCGKLLDFFKLFQDELIAS